MKKLLSMASLSVVMAGALFVQNASAGPWDNYHAGSGHSPDQATGAGNGSPIPGMNYGNLGGMNFNNLPPGLQGIVINGGGSSCDYRTPWGTTVVVICSGHGSAPKAN